MNKNNENKEASNKQRGEIKLENVNVHYGDNHAIIDVNMLIKERHVTAFIGPSGCGKSTLLRCLNRMNDEISGCKTKGSIFWGGIDILEKEDEDNDD